MKEATVYLPDETNAALEQLASQMGRSQTELIQAAIEDYLSRNRRAMPRPIGMGISGRFDLSKRVL